MESKVSYMLRPLKMEDAYSIAYNADNQNIWNNVRDYFPHPYSVQDAMDFISFVTEKPSVQDFAIVVEGEAVGCLGYIPGSDVERISAEVGFWIGEDYWNRGVMSSAVKELINYVFDNTEIVRLFAVVFEGNFASMKVLEKAGFKKLTILHNAAVKNGNMIDLHYFEIQKYPIL